MGEDAGIRNIVATVLIGLSLAACGGSSGPGGGYDSSGFGWMIHANVVEGHDLASIWSDGHSARPGSHSTGHQHP